MILYQVLLLQWSTNDPLPGVTIVVIYFESKSKAEGWGDECLFYNFIISRFVIKDDPYNVYMLQVY